MAQDDRAFLLQTLGQLWLKNVKLNWSAVYAHESRQRIPLPTYPFERQRYWIDPLPVVPASFVQNVKRPLDEWFHLPKWKSTVPLVLQPHAQPLKLTHWLIFEDNSGLGNQLTPALEQQGGQLIKVQRGETFEQRHARGYTINPQRRADYQHLFDALKATEQLPEAVLHLWNLDITTDFEQSQLHGFYSLLFLVQTWPKLQHDRYLFAVSNQIHTVTGAEELQALAATLLGPVQTIGSEYPDLHCRNIDMVWLPSTSSKRSLVAQLLEECQTTSTDRLVAYRNGQRWVRTFEPMRLPVASLTTGTLRHQGVYLITGGLGGIGFSLATYLAKTVQAKPVLIGRTVISNLSKPIHR